MDIRVVTGGFNVKKFASDREYHYLCPLDMFRPEGDKQKSEEVVTRLDSLLQVYVGTKNYHNFTNKCVYS